jgi:hypothetical protein
MGTLFESGAVYEAAHQQAPHYGPQQVTEQVFQTH